MANSKAARGPRVFSTDVNHGEGSALVISTSSALRPIEVYGAPEAWYPSLANLVNAAPGESRRGNFILSADAARKIPPAVRSVVAFHIGKASPSRAVAWPNFWSTDIRTPPAYDGSGITVLAHGQRLYVLAYVRLRHARN